MPNNWGRFSRLRPNVVVSHKQTAAKRGRGVEHTLAIGSSRHTRVPAGNHATHGRAGAAGANALAVIVPRGLVKLAVATDRVASALVGHNHVENGVAQQARGARITNPANSAAGPATRELNRTARIAFLIAVVIFVGRS